MSERRSPWPLLILSIIALATTLLVFAACGSNDDEGSEAPVRAVASLEIFADMVRNVGGDRVDVDALLPTGADVHTYEMPPNKVADVASADVVFLNGLELEHSIGDVVVTNATGPVVELAAGLPVLNDDQEYTEEGDGEAHEGANPHLWLDPRLGAEYVEHIRAALIDVDPEGASVYNANADAYLEQLGDLDREFAAAVEQIPPEHRKLVTFHDAYPYLAKRYGLEIVGVVVPSPGQEPSAQDVADLVRKLEDEDVPAAFSEPQFNADVLEQAASEAGVRVLDLLSDAYVDGVNSYIELMQFNRDQLVEGLVDG